jgi:hypothetical protein
VNEGQTKTADNEATWCELRAVIQERSKIVAVEHKREIDLQVLIPAADAMMFVSAIIQAAKEIITDRDTFRRVSDRMLQLVPPA